ncbi:hypothetical protein QAD02_011980 [Eretmocerus hayati]|uniref:Uncharacterized protein n=1 Tax=Eretmocerus hayati TaxID=131215 RepID=A0ACC2NY38_9HYME|nr:hypothetical protein QAD02_011980 [Eretmocerus hayati]
MRDLRSTKYETELARSFGTAAMPNLGNSYAAERALRCQLNSRPATPNADLEESQFFELSIIEISTRLPDDNEGEVIEFMSKLHVAKSNSMKIVEQVVEEMEVDENDEDLSDHQNDQMVQPGDSVPEPDASTGSENPVGFPRNDLYELLNSSLKGRELLGTYAHTKVLNVTDLKDIIVYEDISKNPLTHKVTTETFLKRRAEIIQLFPSEKNAIIYEPPSTDLNGGSVGARGYLYNYYKIVRHRLRQARILSSSRNSDSPPNDDSAANDNSVSDSTDALCLTDRENRGTYTLSKILKEWAKIRAKRIILLTGDQGKKKKSKKISLEQYYLSFQCLQFPHGNLLSLVQKKLVPPLRAPTYPTRFSTKWLEIAPKIISHFKSSKSTDVKKAIHEFQDLIDEGVHDDIIALLLISLSPRVPKKIKVGSGGSVKIRTLTREEISQSFILRVQIASERAKAQEKFELWLEALGIAKYPYITFVGNLPEVVAYVTFNGGNYHYPEPLKAVEACYKFLNALHIFPPSIPEFAWSVIDLLVYRFTWKTKINANICNFVRDIDPTLATEET